MGFKDIYQEFINLDHSELVNRGKIAYKDLLNILDELNFTPEEETEFLCNILKLFVSADKEASKSEWTMWNSISGLDWTYEQFFEVTNRGSNADFVHRMDNIIDTLGGDGKVDICIIGLCIMSSDGKLTVAEQDLFERILK